MARGIVTTYGYDPATGKLLTGDYADATPDITYTYTRLGQLATADDAAGTHTFSYDAALNRIGEAISGIYAKNFNYTYANTGVKGRYTGFSLDNVLNNVYRLNGDSVSLQPPLGCSEFWITYYYPMTHFFNSSGALHALIYPPDICKEWHRIKSKWRTCNCNLSTNFLFYQRPKIWKRKE